MSEEAKSDVGEGLGCLGICLVVCFIVAAITYENVSTADRNHDIEIAQLKLAIAQYQQGGTK